MGSHQLPLRILFLFHLRNSRVRRAHRTRLVLCEGLQVIEEFTHTTPQSSNLSHDEWLANLFSSGSPSPELPADFPLAIRWVLTSQFPTSSSSMLELSGWAIDLGQASLELMFLVVAVLGSSPPIDPQVGKAIGGTDGQPGTRSSQRRRVPRSRYASTESVVNQHRNSSTHSSSSFSTD